MKEIRIEKVTLNFGAGNDQAKLDKGIKLIKLITGTDPVKTFTKKKIPAWGLRPGLPIGCKLTIRKGAAADMLKRLLEARENRLALSQFDGAGNVSFGIPEYIDIPGTRYDPDIGVMGLEVCVTLERAGYRVKKRKIRPRKLPKQNIITKDDAIGFLKSRFSIKLGDE